MITHLYRDEKSPLDPPLTGQYLSIPAVLDPAAVPKDLKKYYLSREQNKDAPILNLATVRLFESKPNVQLEENYLPSFE